MGRPQKSRRQLEPDGESPGSQIPLFQAADESDVDDSRDDKDNAPHLQCSSMDRNELRSSDGRGDEKVEAAIDTETGRSEDQGGSPMTCLENGSAPEYGLPDPAAEEFCELVARIVARMGRATEPVEEEQRQE